MRGHLELEETGITPSARHRPLMPVLLGFALGITVQNFFSPPPYILLPAIAVSITLSIFVIVLTTGGRACWLAVFMLFIPLGALYFNVRCRSRPFFHIQNVLSRHSGLMRVRGRIIREPRPWRPRHPFSDLTARDRNRWIMGIETTEYSSGKGNWLRTAGGITVFGTDGRPDAGRGDQIELMGVLRPNRPPTNPGQADMRAVYEREGSFGTVGNVTSENVKILKKAPWYRSPGIAAERIRTYMHRRLHERGTGVHPLVRALMFGDREDLPPELDENLQDAGAMHFLAISGLHVGILAGGIWLILSLAGTGAGPKHLLLIAFIWTYVLFTGARISSIRAALMISFLAAAPLLHRKPDPLSSLAGAAFLTLLWRPQQLFSPGFHFTVLAVWAIFYIYPALRNRLWPWRQTRLALQDPHMRPPAESLWMHASDLFVLSASVWLAVTPVSAYTFHSYSLLLPLLNMVLWPLFLPLILGSFLMLALLPAGGPVVGLLDHCLSLFSWGIERLLSACSNLPGFVRFTPGPPLWWVLLYYGFLLLLVKRGLSRGKTTRHVIIAGAAALAALTLFYEIRASNPETLRMTVTDVGHGQCVMLRLPEGGVKLYDAGSVSYATIRGVSGMLRHNRVRHIGALVVSHRHFDHYCFAPELSKKFGTGRLLIPPKGAGENIHPLVEEKLRSAAERHLHVKEGTVLKAGGMHGVFLHPDIRYLSESDVGLNDRSAVLLVEYGGWRIMLPGDAEEMTKERLLAVYADSLAADVLLMPHHGAWSERIEAFLDAVNPCAAVASSGSPLDPRVRRALDERGIAVWTTYDDGAVTLNFGADTIYIEGYFSGRSQVAPRRRLQAADP